MRRRFFLDAGACAGAGSFYLLNRLLLSSVSQGWARWFLTCYANDVFAGLAVTAWLDLLLGWGRLGAVRSWRQSVPFLLRCALVWEVLAPLWKPGATADPWDLLAYQAGGLVYLLLRARFSPADP